MNIETEKLILNKALFNDFIWLNFELKQRSLMLWLSKEMKESCIKQGYALKNCVKGLSNEAYYPWESLKKFDLNWSTLHLSTNKIIF